MIAPGRSLRRVRRLVWLASCLAVPLAAAVVLAVPPRVPTTLEDFHLSGTQCGQVGPEIIWTSDSCRGCHGPLGNNNDPYANWTGSLMGLAGRDPLFYAQLATANQDAANVGYFCLRCHVPMSFVTGHALQPDGSTLDDTDRDGVTCHFCHSLVDPLYRPGVSPPEDKAALGWLAEVPRFYGNSMFVLDPAGQRRGPRSDAKPPHEALYSPFHRGGAICGTCHDVGNVVVSRRPDGTYRYNPLNQRTPDENPWMQFPLERTYTEWRLSAFARGGVDMGGRFGGNLRVVSTCQHCHMPRVRDKSCVIGPVRDDLAKHEFAGAAAPVLDLIADYYAGDPNVDPQAIARGRAQSISMLQRAATLELTQLGSALRARVFNETGHKLPTGHIEGRRVWLNVKFRDAAGQLLREYGRYDPDQAELDEPSTRIYEMEVGLSEEAARITGLPPGRTTHMALADTIVKDNRIPPRGFTNAAYEMGGAPVVDAFYADGQYWDDAWYTIPEGAASVEVTVNYQSLTRHYVEALRDGNQTNHWGQTLYNLWVRNGKGAPIRMTSAPRELGPFLLGDTNGDCLVDAADLGALLASWGRTWNEPQFEPRADLDGDHRIGQPDLAILLARWLTRCP